MKKSIIVNCISVIFFIVELIYLYVNRWGFKASELFIFFTLFPLLLILLNSSISSFLWREKRVWLLNLICPIIIFVGIYIFLGTVFDANVLKQVYINSGKEINNVTINTNVDISNAISTAITLTATSFFGNFIGGKLYKIKKRRG